MTRKPLIVSWLHFAAASFIRNRSLLLAASLSYTTVLSLVPLLAVAFSVAKGFGIYEAPFLRDVLMRLFAERAEVVDAVLGYIQNTNVKALGFIGVATLFVTSFGLLSTMEEAFNIVWSAREQRGLWSRISNYLTVILVCPVFILAAFSLTATLQNAEVVRWLKDIELVNRALTAALAAVPMVMVVISLFILYKFLPNVKVRSVPALCGATAAGVAWQSTQALYIKYQIGVTGYNAIYGSFAQIPLLLVWLYVSWLIVLAGSEVANAVQNFARISSEEQARAYSFADRRDLALLLALLLTERAEQRQPPLSEAAAATELAVPLKVAAEELDRLARIGVAARVEARDEGGFAGYVLAAAPDRITVGELVVAWEGLRGEEGEGGLSRRFPVLEQMRERLKTSCLEGVGMTLRDVWASLPEQGGTGRRGS